jgi:hypothetical protein
MFLRQNGRTALVPPATSQLSPPRIAAPRNRSRASNPGSSMGFLRRGASTSKVRPEF